MKKIPVALQLWSVRDEMRRDFAATVGAVGEMGYHGVELAGYGNLDVKAQRPRSTPPASRSPGCTSGSLCSAPISTP